MYSKTVNETPHNYAHVTTLKLWEAPMILQELRQRTSRNVVLNIPTGHDLIKESVVN
jgi:hypothetical protein